METKYTYNQKKTIEMFKVYNEEIGFGEFDNQRKFWRIMIDDLLKKDDRLKKTSHPYPFSLVYSLIHGDNFFCLSELLSLALLFTLVFEKN